MRAIDRWKWLAVCLLATTALPLAACDIPPEVQAELACTTLCTCFGGTLPGPQREACVQECVADSNLGSVPQDCFECIQAHANACSTLEEDCEPLCATPQPVPDPVLPDGGM